eukprot:scaffold34912_cov68-Phaeocystis_antarctica.AAC.1
MRSGRQLPCRGARQTTFQPWPRASFKQARAGPSHSRDAWAQAVAVLGELAQSQGHCRAPQRATDLP